MAKTQLYVGVDQDVFGGMTVIGKTIRDAWVFGLLPESETCAGWNMAGIQNLLQKVNDEWDKYGCMVSRLPTELRERHHRIHAAAIEQARASGWSGEIETNDED
ncbi:MAG: hypothetical protein KDI83_10605 [Gammaproteobacteria bacterium]|nr:hypothetical protein [Gammaproteobacteria bacterium]